MLKKLAFFICKIWYLYEKVFDRRILTRGK
jgi:hypothetical protein